MADIMDIPSTIQFKEMLSHTFPGFFLATSIFMLIDYLSPENLTSWAMGSLSNMVIFAGFIIIIGTILGVIIDGIHHTFIEDDIFDNFKEIHKLKRPITEQLRANCPAYSDNLTRHFFLPKIGTNGSNAIQLEEHLDSAYYRYSEFYSNIFISLIVFSLVSPFYVFEVMELPWKTSVSIGIASLLTAALCLASSYTSYKTYLRAQCSAICGFIQDPKSICGLNCQEKAIEDPVEKDLMIVETFLIFAATLIIIYTYINISYYYLIIAIPGIILLFIEFLAPMKIIKYISNENRHPERDLVILNNQKKLLSETINIAKSLFKTTKTEDIKAREVEDIIDEYKIRKAKLLKEIIQELKKDKSNEDDIISDNKKIIKYIKLLTIENDLPRANELIENIKNSIKSIENQNKNSQEIYKNCLAELEQQLSRVRNKQALLTGENDILRVNELIQNTIRDEACAKKYENCLAKLKQQISRVKDGEVNINFMSKLSKSSPMALFSFMLNILAILVFLFFASSPIALHVDTTCIKFNENISSESSIKNPVETLSLNNKGDRLCDFSLNINGIANDWLKISYLNDKGYLEKKSNNLTIASGKTRFVQIGLNSSGMDRKNISQGSYLGSIDIYYSNRLKSIPLCINLTKK